MPFPINGSAIQAVTRPLSQSTRAILAVAGVSALLAACSATSPDEFRDVGNMAYPQPLLQGNLSTTSVASRALGDTGNMAYPDPVPEGVLSRTAVTRRTLDTGNMAYPIPLLSGTGPVTPVR